MAVNDALFATMSAYLQSLGLGALATVDSAGNPGGWLWDQITQGFDSADELMINFQQTDVFRERFGVIVEQQRRAASGLPQYVMTPDQVMQYEKRVTEAMTAAALPSWFYDQPEDFKTLMLANISADEVVKRIEQSYEYVDNAPLEVRAKFEEFYGVGQGDAALAAYVLDPSRTLAQLERAQRSAYTAGMAKRFDLSVSKTVAERIAELPRSEAGITEGLTRIAAQGALLNESPFEAVDITADMALAGEFEGDADAIGALQRRQIERAAPNRASTGGAVMTQRGLQGAGYAGGG